MSNLKTDGRETAPLHENLAYALLARIPEMSPNRHQQPTIATSSNL
jgi:hypothetical protein